MEHGNPARVSIHALGCKLNHAELEEYARRFEAEGLLLVGAGEFADAYVLNTCTVTAEADRKVRQWLRSARKHNPDALIVAAGCSAARDRDALLPLADLVFGNDDKERLPGIVAARLAGNAPERRSVNAGSWTPRNRATVKIQEGCSMPCAYCVIPLVRGPERSVPPGQVLARVEQRVREGHLEVILTGTRVGAYLYDGVCLADLVRGVLDVPGLHRLRLSSLQPHELSPDLLELWHDERLCPHVHMSLQSGSAPVLRRMHRGYTPDAFHSAIATLRGLSERMAITTDIIVGFPGETGEEFVETMSFCERAGFSRIHVFPFSPRPGTAAANMGDRVPTPVVKERVHLMSEAAALSRIRHERSCLGSVRDVLWEAETAPGSGLYSGTTEDYIRVLGGGPVGDVRIERVVLDRVEDGTVHVRRPSEDSGGRETELEGARHRIS